MLIATGQFFLSSRRKSRRRLVSCSVKHFNGVVFFLEGEAIIGNESLIRDRGVTPRLIWLVETSVGLSAFG